MKLFVGLGNPGQKYARNRHNVGFMALDHIAKTKDFGNWQTRFHSFVSKGEIGGERVLLLKPQTYYNEAGNAVREASKFLKIKVFDVVVFHDEIDLAPGKLRVKNGGGLAGNNGLRSIQAQLSSPDFARVRIGIGHPGDKNKVASYVLHDFTKTEFDWLDIMLEAIAKRVELLAAGDTERFQTSISQTITDLRSNNAENKRQQQNETAALQSPRSATNTHFKPPATKLTSQSPDGLRKSSGRTKISQSGAMPSQRELAKAGANKRRKKSRKIKKGIQQAQSSTPQSIHTPPSLITKPDETAASSIDPLIERLKSWFAKEKKDS